MHKFFLYLSLFSYPYPCHGWFDTPRCNCLILVSSSCYSCRLLETLPLKYQCTSPFRDCLVLLLVAIFFSSYIHLPVIFFSSSLSLVNITLPILVSIVSLPCQYHFAYPCKKLSSPLPDRLLLVLIPLLLFVAIAGTIILVSSPPCNIPLFFYLPRRYHFIYPCHDYLFTSLISLRPVCYNRLLREQIWAKVIGEKF